MSWASLAVALLAGVFLMLGSQAGVSAAGAGYTRTEQAAREWPASGLDGTAVATAGPVLTGARVNAATLVATFSAPVLCGGGTSGCLGFSVEVPATAGVLPIASSQVDGATVTLALQTAAVAGQTYALSYRPGAAAGNLTDAVGGPVEPFTRRPIENHTRASAAQLAAAHVDRTSLVAVFTEPVLCGGALTGCEGFSVEIPRVAGLLPIASTSVSGATVTLSLATPAVAGETYTVSYRNGSGVPGNLSDATGLPVQPFSRQAVTNRTGVPAARLIGATVDGTTLTATYSAPVRCGGGASGCQGFRVNIPSIAGLLPIAASSIDGPTVTLTLATTAVAGQVYSLAYSPGNLTDAAGIPLPSVANQPIVNRTSAAAARIVRATVNGTRMVATFSAPVRCGGGMSGCQGFRVNIPSIAGHVPIVSSTVRESTITFALAIPAVAGQVYSLNYSPGNVTDAAGVPLGMFANQSIANRTGACASRPRIGVSTVPTGDGRLRVMVSAGEGMLQRISFGTDRRPITGAVVDWPGHQNGLTGSQAFALSGDDATETFFVRRTGSSPSATVPLVVTDDCGDWETFVGMGTQTR